MFLIKILRFFTGYVRFCAKGGFGERFINLCAYENIPLWDIESNENMMFASTTVEGYKKIRIPAKKSGMKAGMIKKAGIPFIIFKHRKRKGILAGIIFFVVMTSFLSTRIWIIDVQGNEKIPEEVIIEAVEKSGIKPGCSRFSIDPVHSCTKAGADITGISSISVNCRGSCATIIVKEREESPEIQNTNGTFNIVSSADAQLVVLEAYCGTESAKLNDTVFKGGTLISGVVKNKDESVNYVHSSGYAVGRTQRDIKAFVASDETHYGTSRSRKSCTVSFFGINIPLGKGNESSAMCFDYKKTLFCSGKKLPLGITTHEYSEYTKRETKLTDNQKNLICAERYLESGEKYCSSRQLIEEKSYKSLASENKQIKGVFTCYENIGTENELYISDENLTNR